MVKNEFSSDRLAGNFLPFGQHRPTEISGSVSLWWLYKIRSTKTSENVKENLKKIVKI